jgi:hypothetical protein
VGDLRFLSCFLFPSVSSWMVPLAWYVVMVRFSAFRGSLNAAGAAVCVSTLRVYRVDLGCTLFFSRDTEYLVLLRDYLIELNCVGMEQVPCNICIPYPPGRLYQKQKAVARFPGSGLQLDPSLTYEHSD